MFCCNSKVSKKDGNLTMLHLLRYIGIVHDSVFINPTKTKSPTTVIIDTHSKSIELQRISVNELYSWNLSYFKLPVHPEMRKLEKASKGSEMASKILETISKKYLSLTFPNLAGQFVVRFQVMLNMYR